MRSQSLFSELKLAFGQRNAILQWLMGANVVVFLLLNLIKLPFWLSGHALSPHYFNSLLALPSDWMKLLKAPWTMITYMFTHVGLFHVLFNMLWLYWFGKIFMEYIGTRKFLPLYIYGGIGGALLFIISYQVFPVFSNVRESAYLIGASASVLAIVVATAVTMPDYSLFLLFFGAVKIKWIALIAVLLNLISIPDGNAGGLIAHLGGAAVGFSVARGWQRGIDVTSIFNRMADRFMSIFRKKKTFTVIHKSTHKRSGRPSQAEVDRILEKISASGYEKLTEQEKKILFDASKK